VIAASGSLTAHARRERGSDTQAPFVARKAAGHTAPMNAPAVLAMLAVLAPVAAAEDVTLTLAIDKGGDLRWKDGPCAADVYGEDGRGVAHVDRAEEVTVPAGTVDVVVACEAVEGMVKKAVRVQAKKPQTVKVKLDPGFVVATIAREGRLSVGEVVVYDAYDHEVSRGRDRTVLPIDAGRVRVQGILSRATAGTSRDVRGEQTVVVKAGAKSELKIDASDGEIVVTVTENGRPAKALVALRDPGSSVRVFELSPGAASAVPSGTWDVVTQLEETHDFREVVTHGVLVVPGKKTQRAIAHRTGTLVPVVTPKDGVTVDLLFPGADAAFNQLEPGGEARLSPGRYVVRATRDVELDDGGKPVATATVTVGAGSQRVTLAPAVADVVVEARVGGEPRPLPVSLSLPGAAAPLVERTADAAGAASFRVTPQKVVAEAKLATAHGPLVARKELALKPGANRVRLDLDVGRATVQVMKAGVAVDGAVRFFERLKGGRPDGEPVVVVKAGEDAWLPPGIYVLSVERRGEQREFGEFKVAHGRVVERALDWVPSDAEKLADEVAREAATKAAKAKKAAPTKDPATKDPATKDPATKDPATKDPATKDPATKDPATKDPATKDPATKDPATKDATKK